MVYNKLRRRNKKKGFMSIPALFLVTILLAGLILYMHSTSDRNASQAFISTTSNVHRPTVAFAVSFIKCSDYQEDFASRSDANLLILRDSIYKISARNPESGSLYDYKMFAIVHKQAVECSQQIGDLGFEVILVDPPTILEQKIEGQSLRKSVHREWCCGHEKFLKLFAYTLPEELVVHTDIDCLFNKPIDHLLDAINFDKDSPEGKAARSKLELERPNEDPLPDQIEAFIAKDRLQVFPRKFPTASQAGFMVARRDARNMDKMVEVINNEEEYFINESGNEFGRGSNKHYRRIVGGSMAMQGLVAYYYDIINSGKVVKLKACRHNTFFNV